MTPAALRIVNRDQAFGRQSETRPLIIALMHFYQNATVGHCRGVVEFALVDVEVHQRVGRGEVVGVGSLDVACDNGTTPRTIEAVPVFGTKVSGGRAASVTFAVAYGPLQCSTSFQEYPVHLSRRG